MLHDTLRVNLEFFRLARSIAALCIPRAELPRKHHARAPARGGIPVWMRFYGLASQLRDGATAAIAKERKTPPITYSRQTRPLNLSKSRFTRADASRVPRGHITHGAQKQARIINTRGIVACRGFHRKSCLGRGIVSHGANLNEIRSAEEAVRDSARFDPQAKSETAPVRSRSRPLDRRGV